MQKAPAFRCKDIPEFAGDPRQYKNIPLRDILASATSGCTLCDILRTVIPPRFRADDVITIGRTDGGVLLQAENFRKVLFTNQDIEYGLITKSKTPSGSTSSTAAFKQSVEWYKTCLADHPKCQSMSDTTNRFFFRLLDLHNGPGKAIVLRRNLARIPEPYACLSYCWGTKLTLQTTSENLTSHEKQGIAWTALPKIFKQVIAYVWRLGIRYLWIDALCIIQDDENDWWKQSALMADIYRNSNLTIAASAAIEPDSGLFADVDAEDRVQKVFAGSKPLGQPPVFSLKPRVHSRTKHPLLSRGWTLQERLLSPRVLHFGASELIWECMEQTDCECGSRLGPPQWLDSKSLFHPNLLARQKALRTANTWRQVVFDFTRRKFTYPSDMLPAISGAAKIVSQSLAKKGLASGYIAGMWEAWFIEDCLWSTLWVERRARPFHYRAPTFSWASVQCSETEIQYRDIPLFQASLRPRATANGMGLDVDVNTVVDISPDVMTLHSRLLEFDCTTEGVDPLGAVTSGYAILNGPVIQGTLGFNNRFNLWEVDMHGAKPSGYPEFRPDYNYSTPGKYTIASGTRIVCLLLLSLLAPPENPTYHYLWCLVLRPVTVKGEHVFERIGLLKCREHATTEVEDWVEPTCMQRNAFVKII